MIVTWKTILPSTGGRCIVPSPPIELGHLHSLDFQYRLGGSQGYHYSYTL